MHYTEDVSVDEVKQELKFTYSGSIQTLWDSPGRTFNQMDRDKGFDGR